MNVQLDPDTQHQRLLDEYENLRAVLWRISRRAESGAADRDLLALAEIETWADEALHYDPSPADQPAATRHDDPDRRP